MLSYWQHQTLLLCMHSNVDEQICFKLGMMTDNTTHYLILVALSLIQCQRGVRKQKLLRHLSHNVFSRVGWWNLVHCWHLLVWWTLYSFRLIKSIFKGEKPIYAASSKKTKQNTLQRWLALGCLETKLFQKRCNDRDYWPLHFERSLADLDLHLRSQFRKKTQPNNNQLLHLLLISHNIWMKF